MYENNLFIKDVIIYNTKDWCSKQYRCVNAMWILYVLLFTHRVIIDKCINVPGDGRIEIDSINESRKRYFKQKMCIIGTE